MDTSLKARMAPHLGLLTIAGIVEDAGHSAEVVNENVAAHVPSPDTDLVGISTTVDVLPRAEEIAREYRKMGIPVVGGGIGVSTDPERARGAFDALCIGPAEGHWPELLKDAESGRLQPEYRTAPDFPGEKLRPPSFRSVDVSSFLYSNVIASSRGCPFACDFCYNSAVAGIGRYCHRTVESVIEEIQSKRTRHIMFIDDNFIGDISFARELLSVMRPLRLKWSAAVSANALIHADYHGRQGIVIEKRFNRLMFRNPGCLRMAKEAAIGGGRSDARNSRIFNIFALIDIGERSGTGLSDIFSIWKENGYEQPTMTETYDPDQVSVVVQVEIDEKAVTTQEGAGTTQENAVTTQENAATTQENAVTTQEDVLGVADKILALIKENPEIALGDIAEKLGISRDGVKYHIEKLKKSVGLVHEGATKKGRWIVVNT